MAQPSASGARGLGRLAALFSLRTISGKLIIGLALLFGVASIGVSVVTDHSLNQSLMSSLNQQLQAATDTWYSCVQHSSGDPDHDGSGPGRLPARARRLRHVQQHRAGARHVRAPADRRFGRLQEHGEEGVPAVRPGRGGARGSAVRPQPAPVRPGRSGSAGRRRRPGRTSRRWIRSAGSSC